MDKPDFETVGGRLYYARMIRGFSQQALAKKAILNGATISLLEANKHSGRATTYEKLSNMLNVSPAWLLFGVGEVPK